MKFGILESENKGIKERLFLAFLCMVGMFEALIYGRITIHAANVKPKSVNVNIEGEVLPDRYLKIFMEELDRMLNKKFPEYLH